MEENLILKERETKQKLVDVISQAHLPAFILQYIIKDLYEEVSRLASEQYAIEVQKQKESKEKKEEDICEKQS